MRVMVLVKATIDSEAGVMLAGEGLHPSSRGVRAAFDDQGRIADAIAPILRRFQSPCEKRLIKSGSAA